MSRLHSSPVSEICPPKLRGVALGYAELVASERPIWEHCLQFTEHVTKHKTKLSEIAPVMRILIEHFFLAFFKQLYGLLTLPYKVYNKHVKMFIII